MSEQYEKGIFVMNYLKELDIHPITIAESVSNDNYRKSYQLIQENPNITKEEFLEAMGIEEYIPGPSRVLQKQKSSKSSPEK